MDSQKFENLLNLALDATSEEREKSEALDVGYDAQTEEWELIVRYHGTEQNLREKLILSVNTVQGQSYEADEGIETDIQIDFLYGGYAILTVPEYLIDRLPQIEEIEYIEKPKRLFFSVNQGKQASCILPVQTEEQYGMLRGRGVLVAIIDSGIDYTHPDFRNADGTTRIAELWDQTLSIYTREQIDQALMAMGDPNSIRVSASQRYGSIQVCTQQRCFGTRNGSCGNCGGKWKSICGQIQRRGTGE